MKIDNNLYYLVGCAVIKMKRKQCQELINFFLAVLSLLIIGPSLSSAQMCETDSQLICASSDANPIGSLATGYDSIEENLGVEVQNWKGFAAKDGEYIPIRLNMETIRTVDPAEVRRLLALNISLEEVKSQARTSDGDVILRGRIRFNNDSYWLMDIRMTSSENGSNLEAKIASRRSKSGSEDATSIVGNTAVAISVVDGMKVAEGYAVINDAKYSGTYNLMLNECNNKGLRAGKLGWQR